ncbi:MAG: hypothetical protein ACREBW_08750 [Candidatus Micrarchaeaceae archaeon]
MNDQNRYQKEQDLIFQQIEELELQEKQAFVVAQEVLRDEELSERYKTIARLCRAKAFQDLMKVSTPDARVEIIRACVRAWEENRKA